MKMLNKIIPYKVRRIALMSGIAGATIVGCAKSNPQEKQHDTIYQFNDRAALPVEKIAASADSAQVRYVILQAIKYPGWAAGVNADQIKELWIEPAVNATKPDVRHKLKGEGTLLNINNNGSDESKKWLENFGFEVIVFQSRSDMQR